MRTGTRFLRTTGAVASTPGGAAPVNTVAPVVTPGSPLATDTLSTTTGTWTGSPSFTYQWQQSTDGGATFTNIGGATSSTRGSLVATRLYRCQVTGTNGSGATTVTSNVVTVDSLGVWLLETGGALLNEDGSRLLLDG